MQTSASQGRQKLRSSDEDLAAAKLSKKLKSILLPEDEKSENANGNRLHIRRYVKRSKLLLLKSPPNLWLVGAKKAASKQPHQCILGWKKGK